VRDGRQSSASESRLLGEHLTKAYALRSPVLGSFLGASMREVEAGETFDEPVSSRSTVPRTRGHPGGLPVLM
jgi:hypothetical protein